MTDDTDAPWYAVMTRAGMEGKADADLRRQGFRTFYPFERVREKRKIPNQPNHRIVIVEKPLFSRYLFVSVRRWQSMRAINDCNAVSTIVYMAGEPLRIPDSAMDKIMDLADGDGLVRCRDETAAKIRALLPAGTLVQFRDDTLFSGRIAKVLGDSGKVLRVEIEGAAAIGEIKVDPGNVDLVEHPH